MNIKPIPKGYEGATPYLCCKNAADVLEFYKKAFGATEIMRLAMADGKVGHAEIRIGSAIVMLSDEYPDWGCVSPITLGGSPNSVLIYVEDVDAFAERAIAAGAKVLMPVKDQFYGDRTCKLEDPSGQTWMFSSRIEDLSPEEIQKRADSCGEEADK